MELLGDRETMVHLFGVINSYNRLTVFIRYTLFCASNIIFIKKYIYIIAIMNLLLLIDSMIVLYIMM